ncbi:hypothetical protein Q3G72_002966 [Acer saccharum]|nr:hypothetical protein Q3G72_002966 [Acer saccharum]
MDFSAILRKSASSSATETEKCSSNESLLQAIDSEFKRIVHVEETPNQFTFELNRDFNKGGRASIELTKEFQGELVQVVSGYFYDLHFDLKDLTVTISKHRGSSLTFNCYYTPDEISISDITVHDRHQYLEIDLDVDENVDKNENLKKVFQKYLEVEKPRSEFTLKIENSAREHGVVLTRELRGELVEVNGYIESFTNGKDGTRLYVTISTNGDSFLNFGCFGTSDAISIRRIGIINSKGSQEGDDIYCDAKFDDMDESLKKAFFEYLEIRGIKPSIVDFMIKCYRYLKAKKNAYGVEED